MGVSMSITKNAKYGKPAYAALGNVDEEGAEGAEEATAPALEANSETIDKIKQENFDKWSKIFRDLTRNKKIEKKIKSTFNKFKTEKLEGKTTNSDESSKPQEGGDGDDAPAPAGDAPAPAGDAPADMNDFIKFANKEIKASEDKVFEYMSGDDKYSFFLKEDIDKFWLVDEKVKELLDERTAGLIVELGKNEKKFKKANEEKYNELSDVVTKITKEIVPIMFEKTQIAVQHKALKDILDFAIDSDELKDFHKKQNISGQKEAITSGDVSADEVAMEKREKDAEAKEQKAAEEGPSGGDGYSSDSSGGGYSSDSSSGGYSSDGGGSYMSGGDNIDGGKLFKTAEEKEYKKFKGEERKEFAEKKDKFMKDEVKVIAFLDANIESLMTSYKKNKVGVNVQKSSMKTNTALLEAIFTAVNSYEKEVETTGAAIEFIAKSGEAPAAEEGDKKGEKDGKEGEAGKDGEGNGAGAEEGDKKKGEGKDVKGHGAGAEEGGNQSGGGSHTTVKSTKTKKKRQPKKLPKNINININLGKTNIAYEDTSDSDSSSSDSSDSSSSDSDDEEQGNVIKKGKKQVKYVVNTTAPKKKNRTKRRRQTNDEE